MADVRYVFQDEAIKFLAEGDPSKVIDILKDGVELTDEFRKDLAAFIEGAHPSKVKLAVKQPRGGTRKDYTNSERNYRAHQKICDYRDQTGKKAYDACGDLALELAMSDSSLRKLHDAFNKAEADISRINRDEIDN